MVSNLVFVPIISVSFLLNKNKNKNKKTIKNKKTNKNKNKNNVQCLSQSTNHLRQKRFGTSQFMRNTPPLWLTEWALDLWTTTIRRCGLWRFHVHGWNIAKRSPRRRRSSTILCRDLSWRISTLAMTLNNVTSSVTCWGWSRDLDLIMRKLFGSRGYDMLRKDAEGYHLEFTQHSGNFQSYCHLTFNEGME